MKEALFGGTAARLGGMLKNGSPYYYYAKTGTTGDDELKRNQSCLPWLFLKRKLTNQF